MTHEVNSDLEAFALSVWLQKYNNTKLNKDGRMAQKQNVMSNLNQSPRCFRHRLLIRK